MRPVGYVRVSSREQAEDGFSVEAQTRAIAAFCESQGWGTPTIFADEGRSGFTDVTERRPSFSLMLNQALGGAFDVVVVHRLDRFARSLVVTLRELGRLEKAGVTFVSVGEQMNFATPIGRVFLAMLAALAEYYSRNLSAETKKGLREKVNQGKHVGGLPYGALRADGLLTVDPDRAGTLATLLDLVAREGASRAATALNAAGVPSPKGRQWRRPAVADMVNNGGWLLDQPDPWPARWAAARTAPPVPRAAPGTRRMLTGLLRCACGGSLTYGGRTRNADGTRGGLCLQCRHWGRDRPNGAGCPHRKALAEHYEELVTDWVLRLPDLRRVPERPAEDVAAQRADLARRRRLLGLALADDTLTEGDYRAKLAELVARERALPVPGQPPGALAERVLAAQRLWPLATPEERNALLRQLCARVIITGRDIAVEPVPELDALLRAVT